MTFGEDWGNEGELGYVQAFEELVQLCHQLRPNAPWVSLGEFLRRSEQEEWVVVDVRSQRERKVSVIPGAISAGELEARLRDRAEAREKFILVYCTVGCRSAKYAQKLRKKGFKVFNLRGGVLAWAMDGRMFVTPDGQVTRRVHVYSGDWNVLPPGYESVM